MVELERKKLGELLGEIIINDLKGSITIPDYQRTYCWPEKNVILLMDDLLIKKHENHPYHMGTIILQFSNNGWEIIDGQQRMVTLSLILEALGDNTPSLLGEKFLSKKANEFIAYNKYLIKNFIERQGWHEDEKKEKIREIKNNTSLDALFLQNEPIDLAYTFFSAQNDRGKPLTDYELLKSHHLRYIPWEPQQMHLAQKWDRLLLNHEGEEGDHSVSIVVGFYLYCLRRWVEMDECDPKGDKAIKNEFEAAPIIDEVPPFGEAFYFKESIQGGSHFFAYVDHFVSKYATFQQTYAYQVLWSTISCSGMIKRPIFDKQLTTASDVNRPKEENKKRTHWWFGDVIATFLFAYYLKFGEDYLAEALTCITRVVSQYRYERSKAYKESLLQSAGESRIIMLLERATSPTFFLADLRNRIQLMPATASDFITEKGNPSIRDDYKNLGKRLYSLISPKYVLTIDYLHNK